VSLSLVLLDRDGVINRKVIGGYVNSIEDFEINFEIFDFLKFLDARRIRTAIVTNQQGLGKGITSFLNFHLIHGLFAQECIQRKITPPQLFYCPHLEGTCECRKPKSNMLLAAMKMFNASSVECLMIGDSDSDICAAKNISLKAVHFVEDDCDVKNCQADGHFSEFNRIIQFINGEFK
jgi:D-glycero-D-manno-heptose 1,7-bisphosphate phosphatase